MKMPKYNLDHKGTKYENDFNPAFIVAATSQPTPVSRFISWFIILLITIAIIWASISKVDIVAKGQGKIIPDGQVKSLQSILTGKIENIYIKENDFVKKGDILFDLQDDEYIIKKEQQLDSLKFYKIKLWKNKYLFNKYHTSNKDKSIILEKPDFLDLNDFLNIKKYIQKEVNLYESKRQEIYQKIKVSKSDIISTKNNIEHLKNIVSIKTKKLEKYNLLNDKQLASDLDRLDAEEALILTKNELVSEVNRLENLKETLNSYDNELFSVESEFQSVWLDDMEESILQIEQLENEIIKLDVNIANSRIKSPINGFIQELTKYTVGGVIQSGEEILVIVPENINFVAEALIPSKDIGFVEKGMDAQIKLDAFNFTKYGLLTSKLIHISNDAIEDENLGLVYKTVYKLDKDYIEKNGKKKSIQSGMGLTVEVKTGERRVIEFFLSPIIKHFKESARER